MALKEVEKHKRTLIVLGSADFVRFHGSLLWRATSSDHIIPSRYTPVEYDEFRRLVYTLYPGMADTNIRDVWYEVSSIAPDRTEYDYLIACATHSTRPRVWDTRALEWSDKLEDLQNAVYSTPVVPNDTARHVRAVRKFLEQLAMGDEALAEDYLMALSPLLSYKKPAGVIWFTGGGANGKTALLNVLYRIFSTALRSLTPAAIEDGRAVPALRGALGNIVRESSEARIEDSERYKSLGTHEPITVRLMRSNETTIVNTNFHTVFNANNIPTFADKTMGARRRTLIVPFPATFKDDPEFEDRTFTPEFLGAFLHLLTQSAQALKANGFRYNWSSATLGSKQEYDAEANSAEAFVKDLVARKVGGFSTYLSLRVNYETWCATHGFEPQRITGLRRALVPLHPTRTAYRSDSGKLKNGYCFKGYEPKDLKWLDNGYGIISIKKEQKLEGVGKW